MAPAVHGEQRTRYIYTSTFIFENRGSSPYNLTEADATITLFMNDTWQTVKILNSTAPITRSYYDEDGNLLAILNFSSKIPPNSKLEFSVSYDMQVSSRSKPALDIAKAGVLADVPDELANKWTNKTVTFTTGDRAIKELAEGLTKNQTTVLGKVLNLLGWFEDHVSANSAETPRYPNETLSGGKGDCDDQAMLLITMLRTLGIPAYLQVGVVFSELIQDETTLWWGHLKSQQSGIGWHGWAMVYVPPWGWLPIDMTLIEAKDPISRIVESPEYGDFIVACMNISEQDYVGETRRARDELVESELYVTSVDKGVLIKESSNPITTIYVMLGISGASVIIVMVAFVVIKRRK